MNKKNALLNIMNGCERWLGTMTNDRARMALEHMRLAQENHRSTGLVLIQSVHFRGAVRCLPKSKRRKKVLEDLAAAFAMEDAPDETV